MEAAALTAAFEQGADMAFDTDWVREQFPAFPEPSFDGWVCVENAGALRVGFLHYTSPSGIERLIAALDRGL